MESGASRYGPAARSVGATEPDITGGIRRNQTSGQDPEFKVVGATVVGAAVVGATGFEPVTARV